MDQLGTVLAAHRAYLRGWDPAPGADPDLVTYRSDVPHATLNGVLRLRDRPAGDALREARARLDGVPRIWWVGPDSDPGTSAALQGAGAVKRTELPIMVADLIEAPKQPPETAGLEITRATDLVEYATAYGRVSGVDPAAIDTVVERERAQPDVVRLAGRGPDGTVAGTATAWFSHDIVTLYFVGTQPAHRRQGVGAAMTAAVLDLARQRGVTTAALSATPMAVSLYHRLGFRQVGAFDILSF
ncbi:GNAT family N-acetyltransferase [Asanoa siamensis]|uniref:GNAT family N-acetyltransferase n=1 Tax=Asanoa siamensis TaxID=926357 RepID=UPI00194302D1|nr:GNAT family N-acetyltransferase [Asanoa siamensis]